MDTKRDLQNPCLNRYLKGMDQRERNLQRKRKRRLKRIVRETVICITAGAFGTMMSERSEYLQKEGIQE